MPTRAEWCYTNQEGDNFPLFLDNVLNNKLINKIIMATKTISFKAPFEKWVELCQDIQRMGGGLTISDVCNMRVFSNNNFSGAVVNHQTQERLLKQIEGLKETIKEQTIKIKEQADKIKQWELDFKEEVLSNAKEMKILQENYNTKKREYDSIHKLYIDCKDKELGRRK